MFHLAIPTHSIQQSKNFYTSLGLELGRESDQFVIINFYGHQVVCHLDPKAVPPKPQMYPRHFGLVLDSEKEYTELLSNAKKSQAISFKDDFRRYPGKPEEHRSFFIQDPSNNLIEFKWYKNKDLIF